MATLTIKSQAVSVATTLNAPVVFGAYTCGKAKGVRVALPSGKVVCTLIKKNNSAADVVRSLGFVPRAIVDFDAYAGAGDTIKCNCKVVVCSRPDDSANDILANTTNIINNITKLYDYVCLTSIFNRHHFAAAWNMGTNEFNGDEEWEISGNCGEEDAMIEEHEVGEALVDMLPRVVRWSFRQEYKKRGVLCAA